MTFLCYVSRHAMCSLYHYTAAFETLGRAFSFLLNPRKLGRVFQKARPAACFETNTRPSLSINGHIKSFDNLVCIYIIFSPTNLNYVRSCDLIMLMFLFTRAPTFGFVATVLLSFGPKRESTRSNLYLHKTLIN